MPMQHTDRLKTERLRILLEDSNERAEIFKDWYVNKTDEILTEEDIEINGKTYTVGYNREYVKFAIEKRNLNIPVNEIIAIKPIGVMDSQVMLASLL